jgi:F420-0:gamma-glutamyl ligase-like protein
MRLRTLTFRTSFWRPSTNYISEIIRVTSPHLRDGDIIAVSEKAVSTASGNIFDEAGVTPGMVARFLAGPWTRKMWAGPLGTIIGLKKQTLLNLRRYPVEEGAAHKQTALWHVGLLQSLRHYSEGGIDASNLPFTYVSLPLSKPIEVADKIRETVFHRTGKKVTVMIMDGDTTHSWRNLHLAPRWVSTPGLIHFGGVMSYIIGKLFGFKARQTPIAVSGDQVNPDRALWYAKLFHRLCGGGAGRTVWSMSNKMETSLTGVTWEMLEAVDHFPLTLMRLE